MWKGAAKTKTQATRRQQVQKLTFVGHVDSICLLQLLAHELHKSEAEEMKATNKPLENLQKEMLNTKEMKPTTVTTAATVKKNFSGKNGSGAVSTWASNLQLPTPDLRLLTP